MGNTGSASSSKQRPTMGRRAKTSRDVLHKQRMDFSSPRQTRRRSTSIDNTISPLRLQDEETMDQILDFVTTLKNKSEGGEDLLCKFVQRRLGNSDKLQGEDLEKIFETGKKGEIRPPSVILVGVPHQVTPTGNTAKSA